MLDQHRRDGVENAPNVGPKAVGRPSGRSSLSHLGDTVGGGLFFLNSRRGEAMRAARRPWGNPGRTGKTVPFVWSRSR